MNRFVSLNNDLSLNFCDIINSAFDIENEEIQKAITDFMKENFGLDLTKTENITTNIPLTTTQIGETGNK